MQTHDVRIESFNPDWGIPPTDIALIHLGIRQWQVEQGQNNFSNIHDSQADIRDLETYYLQPGGNFFVVCDPDGLLTGFVGLRHDGEGQGTLKHLAVLPERQRQGIARSLVVELIDWAKTHDFKKISLQTGPGEKAQYLYDSLGWQREGILERNGDLLMELDLTA